MRKCCENTGKNRIVVTFVMWKVLQMRVKKNDNLGELKKVWKVCSLKKRFRYSIIVCIFCSALPLSLFCLRSFGTFLLLFVLGLNIVITLFYNVLCMK